MSSHNLSKDDLRKDLATLMTVYLDLLPIVSKYEDFASSIGQTGPERNISKALKQIYQAIGYYEGLFEEVSLDASLNEHEESDSSTLSEPLYGDSEYPLLEEEEFDD